jgi:general secretion pathway protein A
LTPNPAYFYLTRQHELGLEELTRGVGERKGVMLLVGEMGTGKTILLRTLEKSLPGEVLVSYQLNPSLDFPAIVKKMLSDMGIPCDTDSRAQLISFCHEKLGELGKTGKYALLMLDEAQSLSEEVLEDIRILSNIEDARGKLLNVILAGQPELGERISVSSLRSLKHRIGVRVYLRPMDADEISHYIGHRLEVAGWVGGEPLFTKDSLSWFTYSSNGNPRLINIIADNALHRAYRERIHKVDKGIIKQTIASLEGREPLGTRKERKLSLRMGSPVVIAIFIFLLVLVFYISTRVQERRERRAALREGSSSLPETAEVLKSPPETVFVRESIPARGEGQNPPVTGIDTSAAPAMIPLHDIGAGRGVVSEEPTTASESAEPPVALPGEAELLRPERMGENADAVSSVDSVAESGAGGEAEAEEGGPAGREVIVKEGDWLYHIMEKEYGRSSWRLLQKVLEVNQDIDDPNHILPGEKIFLPDLRGEE